MAETIDLRSDTVTRPSEAMRRAMASAEVGDDVYGEDPTVNRLQEKAAALFGREDAMFVPSGTMGNSICLNVLTEPGSEVICDRLAHVFNYEMAGMAVLSGLIPRVVDGERGAPTARQVEDAIRPDVYYLSRTGCISLENTINTAGGRIYPPERFREVLTMAAGRGIPVHLDGARVLNAAVALSVEPSSLTGGVETLMFCLSKGLGAPVGSVVAGSRSFVAEARRVRKLMGGGMRQAGVIAAAGLYALQNNIERLAEDHANARRLAEGLAELPGLSVDPAAVETNIVIAGATDAVSLCRHLRERGVLAGPLGPDSIRLATHLEISAGDIDLALQVFREVLLIRS